MAERKSREYLNKLKKKYGVDVLYSFSRYNSYLNDTYSYMLNYIKHIPQTEKDSIYSYSGGCCHDIIGDLYEGKIQYKDMINIYEDSLFDMNSKGYKYDKTDKDKNNSIANKYENSIRHFFLNYKPLKTKSIIEQFVTIKVGRFVFQGYIDFMHKIDECYIIEDFKTSTIYTGEKLKKESSQLYLYAQALIQKGISIENIKCRYNFLKYCTITYDLIGVDKVTKKNKTKDKNCIRCLWVKECESQIRKWLTKDEYDELEIEDMIQTSIENNNLNNLPKNIQDRFKVNDCYVYIELTKDILDELNNKIIETLEEVEEKTEKAKNIINKINSLNNIKDRKEIKELDNELDELFYMEIDKSKEYWFYNLCGYNRSQHIYWDEYLKQANLFKEDTWQNDFTKSTDNDELDWLNGL